MTHRMRIIGAALVLAAGTMAATGADEPRAPITVQPPVGQDPLSERSVPVTLPTLVGIAPKPRPPQPPLQEGTTVFDLETAIVADGNWWTVAHPKVRALYLLPCELLETLEGIHADRSDSRFRLSGEIYTYKGKTYLLPRRAVELRAMPKAPPAPEAAPQVQPAPDVKPSEAARPPKAVAGPEAKPAPAGQSKPDPATQPAAAPGKTRRPTTRPSADDVAEALLGERPGTPIVPEEAEPRPAVQPGGPPAATTPTKTVRSAAPEGDPIAPGPGRMVADRLVRLTCPPGTDWTLVSFETDNTLREPPLRVLPSIPLERAEGLVSDADRKYAGGVFHVSGEIHKYKGWNYLILRHVMRRRDMGQF